MNLKTTTQLNTGRSMPILGLGTWKLNDDTPKAIEHALKLGYPMIDTSGDYGTQPGIGEGIRSSGLNREDIYIVTKVEENDDAYEATIKDLEELGIKYANLMLIHRPPQHSVGISLWEGLIRAKKDGLTKDIGVSNYSEDQMEELIKESGVVPAVNQIEWTPFGHSRDMLEYCQKRGIVIQAYSPLTRHERLDDPRLVDIASNYGKTPAQLLIRWNLQLGTVPIIKAGRFEHQYENLDVFDFEITDEDMDELESLNEAYSALGTLAYS